MEAQGALHFLSKCASQTDIVRTALAKQSVSGCKVQLLSRKLVSWAAKYTIYYPILYNIQYTILHIILYIIPCMILQRLYPLLYYF